ncbi:MAG: RNA polymerase factor sigma-54 [Proteobacteria bacterium]|nr:RNA polymerase factor sigma-54 [Pseudomonadota bacterium]MBI3498502.1 RNA polymerase factor sigma-54 [Pseudomonadota bacterium]
MAISQRLDLRQSQSLVMTPQLQQAIKLLQLSNLELADYIERELEQNPLLERDEGASEPSVAEESPDLAPVPADPLNSDAAELTLRDTLPAEGDTPLDADDSNLWASAPADSLQSWKTGRGGTDFDDDDAGLDSNASRPPTLRDHLIDQLAVELNDPVDKLVGSHLIEMVDESGYLQGDLDETAKRLGCERSRVEAVLARLQRFDPAGVFARSLAECLALQLRERNRLDPAMQALLDNLELLAKRDLTQLLRLCGVDAEDLREMIHEIKALNPKPGQAFDQSLAQPVIPDIIMRPQPGGSWLIELNSDTLPKVLVNTRYYARVSRSARRKEEKDYLSERFQSANWLVKSLHQRATTILKVASEIVRQQDGFFRQGVSGLKPLILRDIAEAIAMHESTVSRVTTNKFMATPRGMFELKYFFTSSIANSAGGEAHSAEAVRFRIRSLIEAEVAAEVLSDDKLVEILRTEGIDIARRTVAKYREALRIPSSVQRRREKSMEI